MRITALLAVLDAMIPLLFAFMLVRPQQQPVTASLAEAALLAAAVEEIDCVAGRPAWLHLLKIYDRRQKKLEVALAKQLMKMVS